MGCVSFPATETNRLKKPKLADYNPICPHCEKQIEPVGIHTQPKEAFLERVTGKIATLAIFSCPECHKIPGATEEFFMKTEFRLDQAPE